MARVKTRLSRVYIQVCTMYIYIHEKIVPHFSDTSRKKGDTRERATDRERERRGEGPTHVGQWSWLGNRHKANMGPQWRHPLWVQLATSCHRTKEKPRKLDNTPTTPLSVAFQHTTRPVAHTRTRVN